MSIIVRCAQCATTVEFDVLPEAFVCPGCGATYRADELAGITYGAAEVAGEESVEKDALAMVESDASPKERLIARFSDLSSSTDVGDVAGRMRSAIQTCLREIAQGKRSAGAQVGAFLDAGRSYAVASFGVWNELHGRLADIAPGTPEREVAERVADEVLVACDAGVLDTIAAIADLNAHGQRLDESEKTALENLWATVHGFDRYPLAAKQMKRLTSAYYMGDIEPEEELSIDNLDDYNFETGECGEAGLTDVVLEYSRRGLAVAPDDTFCRMMERVAAMVVACDTVLAPTHFSDFDELVLAHVMALREDEESWHRSMNLRLAARALEGMVGGIVEHTARILDGSDESARELSEEILANVRAQHDDAEAALSHWQDMFAHECLELIISGHEFEEEYEFAAWKHIFLAVSEKYRDKYWRHEYELLRTTYECTIGGVEDYEDDLTAEMAEMQLALDRKLHEVERAALGDPAVRERLAAEASMIEYQLGRHMIALWSMEDIYETRSFDDLTDEDM